MSTSKHHGIICVAALCVALAVTALFVFAAYSGKAIAAEDPAYASRLFNCDTVHTIDIQMDDWEGFVASADSEEYSLCDMTIDGEDFCNIALRAKGNTSLSRVKTSGSSRYSLKVEFDHYDPGATYHGLDKLCLNNLIQDNTMMKDYLAYRLMADFGADAPLCSYAYVTVNGEDWGLFLAVEGIEDAFLSRNYGADASHLYKPDSMDMGGGRGNGKDFDFDEFGEGAGGQNGSNASDMFEMPNGQDFQDIPGQPGQNDQNDQNGQNGGMPGAGNPRGQGGPSGQGEPGGQGIPSVQGGQGAQTAQTALNGQFEFPQGQGPGQGQMPDMPDMPQGQMPDMPDMPDMSQSVPDMSDIPNMPDGFAGMNPSGNPGGFGGGMNSSDVKLQYIDDNPSSYSNIFNNAKTKISTTDQRRLISSLKSLSSYENLEDVLDTEEVLRYFVVHNFVCNGDSYTGSMVHNYYLHESSGQLSMIPWDYNLAFGTFGGGNATNAVNARIDNPVENDSLNNRPMVGWIFSSQEYTDRYHALFSDFISRWFSDGQLAKLIAETADLIAPYVQNDPTKFCSYEKFQQGVSTLSSFVDLRAQAVTSQLNGSDEQVDASELQLSAMGSMNG